MEEGGDREPLEMDADPPAREPYAKPSPSFSPPGCHAGIVLDKASQVARSRWSTATTAIYPPPPPLIRSYAHTVTRYWGAGGIFGTSKYARPRAGIIPGSHSPSELSTY